jgi:hypothetical protein
LSKWPIFWCRYTSMLILSCKERSRFFEQQYRNSDQN